MADPAPPEDEELRLPDKPVAAPAARLVALDEIHELENSRSALGDVSRLAENIRVRGLLHPVLVRPAPAGAGHGRPYELIAGYRRLAAFRELGREQLPVIVREADDEEVLAELVSENLERENPNPLDEARTMQRMIDVFELSHREVGARLGLSKSQVTKRLGLLRLPEKVQSMVGEGQLTASHAEVIARLDRPESQEELAELAVKSEAPVAKLNGYASKIKERDDQRPEADEVVADPEAPLDPLLVSDVVAMTRLVVREELGAEDLARANLLILLRNGYDEELLTVLAERYGIPYGQLWEWVEALDDGQVAELTEILIRRWLGAAHRYPTFSPGLLARFGAGTSDEDPAALELPEGISAEDGLDDWDEEWGDDDEF